MPGQETSKQMIIEQDKRNAFSLSTVGTIHLYKRNKGALLVFLTSTITYFMFPTSGPMDPVIKLIVPRFYHKHHLSYPGKV